MSQPTVPSLTAGQLLELLRHVAPDTPIAWQDRLTGEPNEQIGAMVFRRGVVIAPNELLDAVLQGAAFTEKEN